MHAFVVVLGDLGRSPRMKFHSLSLAKHGWTVDLIGYSISRPHKNLSTNSNIRIVSVPPPPENFRQLTTLLAYSLKLIWQILTLFFCLFLRRSPNVILVQNPPAVPALPICWLIARLKSAKLVIDWHNYTCSMLAMQLHERHRFVNWAHSIEKHFGAKADINLCVSRAMREDLQHKWNVKAITLYDRPALTFRPITLDETHNLWLTLAKQYALFRGSQDESFDFRYVESWTRFSIKGGEGDQIELRDKRPAVVVSSTSWTADEDFGMLLEALQLYDSRASSDDGHRLPHVIAIITGKGPLKDYYNERISQLEFGCVEFCTPWLEAEDYPRLLASADLGVCLHSSTSGLDLPMKVVDMFGCRLPVLALGFPCIGELVRNGENGLIFASASELCEQLCSLLQGFPVGCKKLSEFRENLNEIPLINWDDSWDAIVWPLLKPFE